MHEQALSLQQALTLKDRESRDLGILEPPEQWVLPGAWTGVEASTKPPAGRLKYQYTLCAHDVLLSLPAAQVADDYLRQSIVAPSPNRA